MEFTDENKQTILDLLKSGQRQAAVNFISAKYNVSDADAQKLLSAFETQFHASIREIPISKTTSSSGCSGCLSGILKVLAILIGLLGIGTLGVGYFMSELIRSLAKTFNASENLNVPVKVIDQYYYASPDSSYVLLIFEIKYDNQVKYDTSNTIYSADMYFKGDTLRVEARDLDFLKKPRELAFEAQIQKGLYILGGALLFFAFIFWMVGSKYS